ncbi:G2/mitotic-specific cyclin-B1-like isoform X2 [Atheta coriaria]|uniref:G2/mitotic-specific cyclin-B1-like isoform X2 n=1 Tax=Dalotia coriaria TaxID=877792 RepID=UPI0031F46DDF
MRRNCVHIEAEDKPAGPGFSSRIPSARPPLREVQNADKRPLRYKKSSVDNLGTACAETQTSCLDSPLNKKHASKPEVITKSLKLRPIEDRFERNELSAASGKSAKSTDASTSKPRLGENKEVAGLSLTSKHCFIKSDANEKYCKYEFVVKYVHSDGDNLKPRKAVSPILPNPDVGKDVLLARFAEEPARKKTLLKARRLRTDQRDENSPYCIDIFNREYLAENMQESLRMDMYYTGRRGFLEKHNSHLTERDRSKILNWILTIAEDIKLSEYVYFKLVRLLDNILENLAIPKNMLQLVAIVACWILLKMDETWVPSVRKVGTLCANVYTTKQILDMEMKLLNFTAFNLKISAPNDFFYFQIVLQNDFFL